MRDANSLRLKIMRHNASRKAHKRAISRRPKKKSLATPFVKPVFVDMDKKPKVVKEKKGFFRTLFQRKAT